MKDIEKKKMFGCLVEWKYDNSYFVVSTITYRGRICTQCRPFFFPSSFLIIFVLVACRSSLHFLVHSKK